MRKWLSIILTALCVGLLCWWVHSAPLFRVHEYTVTGINQLSRNEVVAQLGNVEGMHFINVLFQPLEEKVQQHHRVRSAQVSIQLPGRLHISVQERVPVVAIPFHNSYLIVDEEGYVLDVQSALSTLPTMTGLHIPLVSLGERIPLTPNFLAGIRVLQQLDSVISQRLDYIDVESAMRVLLRMNGYETLIDVGDGFVTSTAMSQNMAHIFEILKYLQDEGRSAGILYISERSVSYSAP